MAVKKSGAPKRILLVASRGGHWVQLARLTPAFHGMDAQYVTTGDGGAAPHGDRPVAVVVDASKAQPLHLFPMAIQIIGILSRFRPQIVVTTGAAPGAVALWLAKFVFGSKTIWVDSIANSERISLSAKLVNGAADLRLTQWPELADEARGIEYFGAVI